MVRKRLGELHLLTWRPLLPIVNLMAHLHTLGIVLHFDNNIISIDQIFFKNLNICFNLAVCFRKQIIFNIIRFLELRWLLHRIYACGICLIVAVLGRLFRIEHANLLYRQVFLDFHRVFAENVLSFSHFIIISWIKFKFLSIFLFWNRRYPITLVWWNRLFYRSVDFSLIYNFGWHLHSTHFQLIILLALSFKLAHRCHRLF